MIQKKKCRLAIVASLVLSVVSDVEAQVSDTSHVAITMQGLASVQPVDDFYVGSPYLDKGLGGVGPGAAVGIHVVMPRRFEVAFEFSTATLDVLQTGRLVSGTAEGQLRDSLYSLLVGASVWSSANVDVVALAGLSLLAGSPAQNGVSIERANDPATQEGDGSIAFTGGVDVLRRIGRRIGVIGSARYSLLPRSRRAEELGVGPHVLRLGGGLHIRLTR